MTSLHRLDPVPDIGGPQQPLLSVGNLTKHFPVRGGLTGPKPVARAVDGVSFSVAKGETLGVVGESGCGKSTTARLLMRLIEPDGGDIVFDGETVGTRSGLSLRELRRRMQMVFQDSYASLNPRLTIADSLAFAPMVHGVSRRDATAVAGDLLGRVGLDPGTFMGRYPHELSGGQRQRVNIARALALRPRLVILDEAVSALDKSVEAQVLNLLVELKRQLDLTYIFISHDLNVVHYISDRVLVMYLGKVAEVGPVEAIYGRPAHPYTRALFSARLSMDPDERTAAAPLQGDPPNPINPPSGCRFRTRCPHATGVCAEREPVPMDLGGGHIVACHLHDSASGHPEAHAYA
ncbi:ABC transporter ATP-binding protein [Azospirillum isscasi]|uniref:Glutathione import ATP-binding protein GsiA n=1 Tax=Azospirillum isscasi TaxID=3053926 RepID=A0ABU0WAE2_9PROT|nr:oligopeptide/dipeptide ABC transporter ATP-binding protein [Azospirillum isscasi]MDQ2101155.1 ATP-binding cassette domain-containing protein [Azospirillum isscasi]